MPIMKDLIARVNRVSSASPLGEALEHPNFLYFKSVSTPSRLRSKLWIRQMNNQDDLPIPTAVALLALLDPEGWQSGLMHRS
jgi:hypothetical protein